MSSKQPQLNQVHFTTIMDIIMRYGKHREYMARRYFTILATFSNGKTNIVITFECYNYSPNEFIVGEDGKAYRFGLDIPNFTRVLQLHKKMLEYDIIINDDESPMPREQKEKFIIAFQSLYDRDNTGGLTKRAITAG